MYALKWVLWTCSGKKEAFKLQFVDYVDFYLVHKVFNMVVSNCKAGPVHMGPRQQFVAAEKEVLAVLEASDDGPVDVQ